LLPILRQKKQRKCYSTRIFGSSISVQQTDDTYTCPQGEILKPREDGTRKGRTEQSGYQFTETRLQKLSSKTIYAPVEQQEEKLTEASMRKALKKITNAIKKTRNYTERDKR
jgi:hypothetical protein